MKTSPAGRAFIEGFEALFLQAYDDSDDHILKPGDLCDGTLTIGWGHTTDAGAPRVYIGMEITKQQADDILSADLMGVEIEVEHLVKAKLNQNQFDALVSFQFNTGWLAHPQCSLLNALNGGNYNLADHDFTLYDRSQGKVLKGLVRRRLAEKKLFMTPVEEA